MFKLFRQITVWFHEVSRRIFLKLILIIVIPNLLLVLMVNHLITQQIDQKVEEMHTTLNVLEHATGREIRALFNDVTTLTNQILIEPEVQRILSSNFNKPVQNIKTKQEELDLLRETYLDQETIRTILARYRLVWNNIFSITIVDVHNQFFLNTSENYAIDQEDLERSLLLKEVLIPEQSGLVWSVNDQLTKNADMITIVRKIYGINQPKQVIGYVVINLSLNAIRKSFETYNYYDQMVFGMINKRESEWMVYDNKQIQGDHGKLFSLEPLLNSSSFSNVHLKNRSWEMVLDQIDKQNYLFVGLDKEFIAGQAKQFRKDLYFGYLFFLILAVFISLRGTKVLSQRLGLLIKSMRKFGQKQWGTRIHLKGSDEIQVIGDQFNLMASHIEALIEDLNEQQRLKRLFELRVLEYQINPHFLYNTLDSIHWLAIENNQPSISKMVNGLSKLFRMILSKGREMITLSEEFEMIKIYLNIQKFRFEDRFDFHVELDSSVSDYPVAKLVLQPIVENALVHGIRKLRAKGFIHISGYKNAGNVILEIQDNGVGMSSEQVSAQMKLLESDVLEEGIISSSGYGIKNVDSRLKLMYGDDYRMNIISNHESAIGTTVQVIIHEKAMKEKRL